MAIFRFGLLFGALVLFSIAACAQTAATDCSEREEKPPRSPGAETGKPYSYTLYTHCGILSAYFDGRRWMADPMLTDGSGNPPPGWGNPFDRLRPAGTGDDTVGSGFPHGGPGDRSTIEPGPWAFDDPLE